MSEIKKRTVRLKLDTSAALPNTISFESWRGNALDIQIGIYDANGIASISDIQSVTLKVQASQLSNTTLMESTVASGAMDNSVDAASWDDGSKQHATFSFTDSQTNLTLSTAKLSFWCVITAILTGGETHTLAAGDFVLHEDNDTTAGDPDANPGSPITIDQADARYAQIAAGVPQGGTAGQALVKSSDDDYDMQWATGGAGGISNVVDDVTPQLGVNLDTNGKSIISAGNQDININPNGTGELKYNGNEVAAENSSPNFTKVSANAATLTTASLTSGAAISWDASAISQPKLTLGENAVLNVSNLEDGQTASLSGIMGGGGSYSLGLAHSGLTIRTMSGDLSDIAALDTNDLFEISIKRSDTDLRYWVSTKEI